MQNIFGRRAGFNLGRAIFALPREFESRRPSSPLHDAENLMLTRKSVPMQNTYMDLFRSQYRVSDPPIFQQFRLAYLTQSFNV